MLDLLSGEEEEVPEEIKDYGEDEDAESVPTEHSGFEEVEIEEFVFEELDPQ